MHTDARCHAAVVRDAPNQAETLGKKTGGKNDPAGKTAKEMNLEAQMDSAMRHMKKQMSEIPRGVIANARGLVFLTMIKGALIWSGSLSTGIVVKRLTRNSWSPPVSVGMASVGFGLQAGGEKVEIIIVIGDDEEIEAFAGTGQLKLGVSVRFSNQFITFAALD